ncbi:hypothetical protein CONPUDRAFT_166319 [Coniophora puteana RWD-64-598 SS2]|uniref:C2 NT-type domain-containing protein n=1 Tax=Coniophora puteana (strain RWD-64-598) TaxID=741705 RepID=A0A5M3MLV9_CONPW|nr:uncharacterized protein CONPUDRAFT_166319 [Coniophora puteana RWD-64-598 SS2]EIW79571.1 hypothetical protein CONPUDRAFT_166319 [Coniophora puteana RWD-64-598 SS2]
MNGQTVTEQLYTDKDALNDPELNGHALRPRSSTIRAKHLPHAPLSLPLDQSLPLTTIPTTTSLDTARPDATVHDLYQTPVTRSETTSTIRPTGHRANTFHTLLQTDTSSKKPKSKPNTDTSDARRPSSSHSTRSNRSTHSNYSNPDETPKPSAFLPRAFTLAPSSDYHVPPVPPLPTGSSAHVPPSSKPRFGLGQLLPKHALFLARVNIHQLSSVPLVSGEFGVRWRVKGVTNPSKAGFGKPKRTLKKSATAPAGQVTIEENALGEEEGEDAADAGLGQVSPRGSSSDGMSMRELEPGPGRHHDEHERGGSPSMSDAHSIAASTSTRSTSNSYGQGHGQGPGDPSPFMSIPSVVVSASSPISAPNSHPYRPPSSLHTVSTQRTASSATSSSAASSHTPGSTPGFRNLRHLYPGAPRSATAASLDSSVLALAADFFPTATRGGAQNSDKPSLVTSAPSLEEFASAKGHTLFGPLKDHAVEWEQTLNFVLQMGVKKGKDKGKEREDKVKAKDKGKGKEEKEVGELADCEARFVVMQRVVPGDPNAPSNPRLGAITLNLAQYVDAGSVTRRYLLRQSKTNAVLKVTIQLEHIGGETAYVAPPLPKGEILGGVAGLLDNDVYRTRPRDIYVGSTGGACSSSDGESLSASSGGGGTPSKSAFASFGELGHPSPAGGKDKTGGSAFWGGLGEWSKDVRAQRRKKKRRKQQRDAHGNAVRTRPFDLSRLPEVHGVRATERLVDALFNPVATTGTTVSPFTYYVGGSASEDEDDLHGADARSVVSVNNDGAGLGVGGDADGDGGTGSALEDAEIMDEHEKARWRFAASAEDLTYDADDNDDAVGDRLGPGEGDRRRRWWMVRNRSEDALSALFPADDASSFHTARTSTSRTSTSGQRPPSSLRRRKPAPGELDELSIYGGQRENGGGEENVGKRPWWRKMLRQNGTALESSTPSIHVQTPSISMPPSRPSTQSLAPPSLT